MSDHLYFIRATPSNHIKIGRSSRVKQRVAELQVGSMERLSIELIVHGQGYMEPALHAKHRADRVQGEWHRCSRELRLTLAIMRAWVEAFEPWVPNPLRQRRPRAQQLYLKAPAPPEPAKPQASPVDALTRIGQLAELGLSLGKTARRLNEEGYPTPSGNGRWHSMQVKRVIDRHQISTGRPLTPVDQLRPGATETPPSSGRAAGHSEPSVGSEVAP